MRRFQSSFCRCSGRVLLAFVVVVGAYAMGDIIQWKSSISADKLPTISLKVMAEPQRLQNNTLFGTLDFQLKTLRTAIRAGHIT